MKLPKLKRSTPPAAPSGNTRKLTIIAKDPGVRFGDKSLAFASVDVPAENLTVGPTGFRVKVVDYDATSQVLYRALADYGAGEALVDPFAFPPEAEVSHEARMTHQAKLLADPNFHAQNAYAVAMRTLARFEFALGRRVSWGFRGHQLHIAPHAFLDANAFYSEEDQGLFFGYFPGLSGETVFTCLSHDIVAHETTHALLDGLRTHFTEPSIPDQAAFHEAFADVVALLSIFSLPEIVARILRDEPPRTRTAEIRRIPPQDVTFEALKASVISGLGLQVGREFPDGHGAALRQSVALEPAHDLLDRPEFQEEHRRGEVLAAAMMRAFLAIWRRRIDALGTFNGEYNLDMVVESGAKVADHLLTMAIRAIDYCPPTDLDFSAYLAALLTADAEVVPDDSRYHYRATLAETFAAYGIRPPVEGCGEDGCWLRFRPAAPVTYARANFDSMLRDRDEVFRFIWENRAALGIDGRGRLEVDSVLPSVRHGPDGFLLRETVCAYVETADLFGSEVEAVLGVPRPQGMPTTERIAAYGGGVIVFDQYGQIKYHIAHRLKGARQASRLEHLWDRRATALGADRRNRFAMVHRTRMEEG